MDAESVESDGHVEWQGMGFAKVEVKAMREVALRKVSPAHPMVRLPLNVDSIPN